MGAAVAPAPAGSGSDEREAAGEPTVAALGSAAAFAAAAESEFITGPIVPRVPGPVRTVEPLGSAIAGEDVNGEDLEDDDDDDLDDEELDEDDDDSDDEDEPPLDEQDALFNLACEAVEQGDKLTWNQLVVWLLAAEVDDPRLGLLASLLVTEDEGGSALPPALSGERVLSALDRIGFADMVAEARQTVAAAPSEPGESEDERAVVREGARALAAQVERELAAPASKPMRASEVRAAQSRRVER